jgi:hypothetical protein
MAYLRSYKKLEELGFQKAVNEFLVELSQYSTIYNSIQGLLMNMGPRIKVKELKGFIKNNIKSFGIPYDEFMTVLTDGVFHMEKDTILKYMISHQKDAVTGLGIAQDHLGKWMAMYEGLMKFEGLYPEKVSMEKKVPRIKTSSDLYRGEYLNEEKTRLELVLLAENERSWREHGVLPVPAKFREFFPGYKVDFVLQINGERFKTKMSSAKAGTPIGHPTASNYLYAKQMFEWLLKTHSDIKANNRLVFERLEEGLYKMEISKKE